MISSKDCPQTSQLAMPKHDLSTRNSNSSRIVPENLGQQLAHTKCNARQRQTTKDEPALQNWVHLDNPPYVHSKPKPRSQIFTHHPRNPILPNRQSVVHPHSATPDQRSSSRQRCGGLVPSPASLPSSFSAPLPY